MLVAPEYFNTLPEQENNEYVEVKRDLTIKEKPTCRFDFTLHAAAAVERSSNFAVSRTTNQSSPLPNFKSGN
jgi:hypothetical protein